MTTNRNTRSSRRPSPPSERTTTAMFHIEYPARRGQRSAKRVLRADARASLARVHAEAAGSLRLRLGESLVRLGRRVGGDAMTTPAWLG